MEKNVTSAWKYYNHMILPNTEPKTEQESLTKEQTKALFRLYKKAFCIRYTTEFDKFESAAWWYCIKDSRFDINAVKSKRRCVINKGIRNFTVRCVDPREHIDDFYYLINDANQGYDNPVTMTYEQAENKCVSLSTSSNSFVLGAFDADVGKLVGYLWCQANGKCISLIEQHCIREYERLECNAALLNGLCEVYNDRYYEQGYYLCDGERNIAHDTEFQAYLIKYFGFRYAYCRLHVVYRPCYRWCFRALFTWCKWLLPLIEKVTPSVTVQINALKKMYDYAR
ncbi:MAG: hypothetical protein VB055_01965 [Oscillospiraceae bacterium]|nr:hypothetical protein [Oscillospiraceae bacterium]